MERIVVRIAGADRRTLTDALKLKFAGGYVRTFDNNVVMASDSYYLRVGSSLTGIAILDFTEAGKCRVDLISGGGSEGMWGITWGSEKSNNRQIADYLKDICMSYRWQYSEDSEP